MHRISQQLIDSYFYIRYHGEDDKEMYVCDSSRCNSVAHKIVVVKIHKVIKKTALVFSGTAASGPEFIGIM